MLMSTTYLAFPGVTCVAGSAATTPHAKAPISRQNAVGRVCRMRLPDSRAERSDVEPPVPCSVVRGHEHAGERDAALSVRSIEVVGSGSRSDTAQNALARPCARDLGQDGIRSASVARTRLRASQRPWRESCVAPWGVQPPQP